MQDYEDGCHPTAFHSRSLLPAECNYDTHNKDLLGIIFGFKATRPLFLGTSLPIHIRTDHSNLCYFCHPQKITNQQVQWFEFLQDFDYTLKHIPRTSNTIADLLSHRKDLNKGADSDLPRVLLPDHLFFKKVYLADDTKK